METEKMCYICQEDTAKIGHETKWCPINTCKQCGQKEHTKIECMTGMEDFPLPRMIVYKILDYMTAKDLDQFSKVSKKISELCKIQAVKNQIMLLPPKNPELQRSCDTCSKRISLEIYYRCTTCDKLDLCNTCYTFHGMLQLIKI